MHNCFSHEHKLDFRNPHFSTVLTTCLISLQERCEEEEEPKRETRQMEAPNAAGAICFWHSQALGIDVWCSGNSSSESAHIS